MKYFCFLFKKKEVLIFVTKEEYNKTFVVSKVPERQWGSNVGGHLPLLLLWFVHDLSVSSKYSCMGSFTVCSQASYYGSVR